MPPTAEATLQQDPMQPCAAIGAPTLTRCLFGCFQQLRLLLLSALGPRPSQIRSPLRNTPNDSHDTRIGYCACCASMEEKQLTVPTRKCSRMFGDLPLLFLARYLVPQAGVLGFQRWSLFVRRKCLCPPLGSLGVPPIEPLMRCSQHPGACFFTAIPVLSPARRRDFIRSDHWVLEAAPEGVISRRGLMAALTRGRRRPQDSG